MWVAMSTDKPEGFLLDRNAHGPHLQPSCLDPRTGRQCQGVGSPVSGSNNRFIVTILFVFPVFCLTWQLGRERAAGSLQFVLGGSCSHTQTLKPEACSGDAFTWGPSVCKRKVWEGFPSHGPAKCGWHFTYSFTTDVTHIQVKGQAYETCIALGSGTPGMVDCVPLNWITLNPCNSWTP